MQLKNRFIITESDRNVRDDSLVTTIISAIQDVKGSKIVDIDFESIESAPTNHFVICEGKSTTQVSSIADNIQEAMRKEFGIKAHNTIGYRNSQWIVIDFGEVMAHVFLPEMRELYNLEELWSDARITEVPDLD